MTRAVVVQHLEPEGPVRIAGALRAAGVEVDVVRTDRGEAVPDTLDGIDGLVVMGGPMSARSDDDFPSRLAEIALLRTAIEAGVPTLGSASGPSCWPPPATARCGPAPGSRSAGAPST